MPGESRNPGTVVQRLLEPGETLLWTGRPPGGLRFTRGDILLVPFTVFWCGFIVLWIWGATHARSTPPFLFLFGLPFVLVGLHLLVGRFLWDARRRARTVYGLTDRRALIVTGLPRGTTHSVPLRGLAGVTLRERKDGSGSIQFGGTFPGLPYAAELVSAGWPGMEAWAPPTFDSIPDARRVHSLVLGALAGGGRPG